MSLVNSPVCSIANHVCTLCASLAGLSPRRVSLSSAKPRADVCCEAA